MIFDTREFCPSVTRQSYQYRLMESIDAKAQETGNTAAIYVELKDLLD